LAATAACVFGLGLPSAQAVIIYGGDGSGNDSAPPGGTWWNYLGRRGGGSAVYLGEYGGTHWAITAYHVGAGDVIFGSQSYSYIPGTAVRIPNPDTSLTDMVLFQLDGGPALSRLPIADATPPTGADLIFVGSGRDRAADLTGWQVDTSQDPWVWTEVSPDQADVVGYHLQSTRTLRWGPNNLDGAELATVNPYGTTETFYGDWDPVDGEGQVTPGDSGGGVFYENGGEWELAGVILYRGIYKDQPSDTAVVGNRSYAGDLAEYRSFILGAVPEPEFFGWPFALGALLFAGARRLRRREKASKPARN